MNTLEHLEDILEIWSAMSGNAALANLISGHVTLQDYINERTPLLLNRILKNQQQISEDEAFYAKPETNDDYKKYFTARIENCKLEIQRDELAIKIGQNYLKILELNKNG